MTTAALPSVLYHLADKVDFRLDPKKRPSNNTTLGGSMPPGIFLCRSPESWVNGYGYWRPWVVEISVDPALDGADGVIEGYAGEVFVPARYFDRLRVLRVVPLDAHCREKYQDWGWTETFFESTFDTNEPLPLAPNGLPAARFPRGYRYEGDARQTDPGWQAAYKKRVKEHGRKNRGAYASRIAASGDLASIVRRLESEGRIVAPIIAQDGDCIVVSRQVTQALNDLGLGAKTVTVWGWMDQSAKLLGFAHQATLVGDTIVDLTATQFDRSLPAVWVAEGSEYLRAMAEATGVQEVTLGQRRVAANPSDDPQRWVWNTERWSQGYWKTTRSKSLGWFTLYAEPVDGDGYGQIHAVTEDGTYIGGVFYGPVNERFHASVEVNPAYRRRGVASAMYQWVEELSGRKLSPDTPHSDYAEKFWAQPNRSFGATGSMMTTAVLIDLEAVISVAEETMERAGASGRKISVPTGHVDDPAYQAAIAPLVAWVREISGVPSLRLYASDYMLNQSGAQAETDGMNYIRVRSNTTEMTILHEVAHVIDRSSEGQGHTPQFARTLRDVYRQHLGEGAAKVFWDIVGLYVDGKVGAKVRQRAARGFSCVLPEIGKEGVAMVRRMSRGAATVDDILRCATDNWKDGVGDQWGLENSEYGPNWADQGAEDYAFVNDDTIVRAWIEEAVEGGWSATDDEIWDELGDNLGEIAVILIGETDAGYVNPGWDASVGRGAKFDLTEVRYNAGWGWKRLPARGHTVTSASRKRTLYRGVPVHLDPEVGDPFLEALAEGQTNVAHRLLIDAMAANKKSRWWDSDPDAGPEDEAGRWWGSHAHTAWTYARDESVGKWMSIPVVMTAQFDEADVDSASAPGDGFFHLPPGVPLTITSFEADLPSREDAQYLLDRWRGVGHEGKNIRPSNFFEMEMETVRLNIPPMRTTAAEMISEPWPDGPLAHEVEDRWRELEPGCWLFLSSSGDGWRAAYDREAMTPEGQERFKGKYGDAKFGWQRYVNYFLPGLKDGGKTLEGKATSLDAAKEKALKAGQAEIDEALRKSDESNRRLVPGWGEKSAGAYPKKPHWRGIMLELSKEVGQRFIDALNSGQERDAAEIAIRWAESSQGGYNDGTGVGVWWSSDRSQIDRGYGAGGNLYFKDGSWAFDRGKSRLGMIIQTELAHDEMDSHNSVPSGSKVDVVGLEVCVYPEPWGGNYRWVSLPCKMMTVTAAGGDLVLYHGTHLRNLEGIKRDGLRPPSGVGPQWFMLTTSREQASRYVHGDDVVVLEYTVPPSAVWSHGNDEAILWPGQEHNVYGYEATAYSLRRPLPTRYLTGSFDKTAGGMLDGKSAAWAPKEVDEGTPSRTEYDTTTRKGDHWFYQREQDLYDAGMPKGQVFDDVGQAQRYTNDVLRSEGIAEPCQIIFSKERNGVSGAQWSRDMSQARIVLDLGHQVESYLLHELAHIVYRKKGSRKGPSHASGFSAVYARLLWERMGVSLSLGSFGRMIERKAVSVG